MSGAYLIDTNHLGALIHPRSTVYRRFDDARRVGVKFGTIVPVLCEIDAGLAGSVSQERCWPLVRRAASFVRIWQLEPQVAEAYGDIYLDLRNRGRVLSQVDLLLAALCRYRNLTLLTTDRDFEALPDIRRENWLA